MADEMGGAGGMGEGTGEDIPGFSDIGSENVEPGFQTGQPQESGPAGGVD